MKTSFKCCEDALAQLDDAKLGDQITQALGNGQSRTVTRAGRVMGHIIDLTDHYSQLANYMRLNNILPPTALPRPRPPGGVWIDSRTPRPAEHRLFPLLVAHDALSMMR